MHSPCCLPSLRVFRLVSRCLRRARHVYPAGHLTGRRAIARPRLGCPIRCPATSNPVKRDVHSAHQSHSKTTTLHVRVGQMLVGGRLHPSMRDIVGNMQVPCLRSKHQTRNLCCETELYTQYQLLSPPCEPRSFQHCPTSSSHQRHQPRHPQPSLHHSQAIPCTGSGISFILTGLKQRKYQRLKRALYPLLCHPIHKEQ